MSRHLATFSSKTELDTDLRWLGQAGFVIRMADVRIVIDPYLSDSLAEKYRGTFYEHRRMQPVPVAPNQLTGIDLILCTHGHTDHMDPATLGPLAYANPNARFILPCHECDKARKIGLPERRVTYVNPGDMCRPLPQHDIQIIATPAAHESFEQDNSGNARFLGYLIKSSKATLYHSGDTLSVEQLLEPLRNHPPNLALLPCNGRDETRRDRGVPGNMTLVEAIQLCNTAGIPRLVPHHFGMFDFNTCPEQELEHASEYTKETQIILPVLNQTLRF